MNTELASTAEFLDLLARSQVLVPARLDAYLRERGGARALPEEARAFGNQLVSDGLLTPYQMGRLVAGAWRGLVVGPYRLLGQLGPPTSTVYLAEKRGGGQRVALKLLPPELAAQPSTAARFRREAEALGRLHHPNIVHLAHFDEHDGQMYLLTEYVEGRSLAEVVEKDGPLAAVQAARIVHTTALALEHLHQAGLVHRDIQPGHLMLDREGTVKLLDLGLARVMDDRAESLTMRYEAGKVLGAIEFLAPEQVANSHGADVRADVYGLGATFYFLLTGKAPFERHALLRLASGVVAHPQPLSQVRPDVPRELAAILERMMALDLEERYQTACEAAAALATWLRQAPISKPIRLPRPATVRVPAVAPPRPTATMPMVVLPDAEEVPLAMLDEEDSGEEVPAGGYTKAWGVAIILVGAGLAFLVATVLLGKA